jgi:hypothetical protein
MKKEIIDIYNISGTVPWQIRRVSHWPLDGPWAYHPGTDCGTELAAQLKTKERKIIK